jgi:hypothetical protein
MYSNNSEVFILGDLNAQLPGPRCVIDRYSPRSLELTRSLAWLQLSSLAVHDICKGPNYTFCPYNGGPQTLIDHIIIRDQCFDVILACAVLNECALNVSDHLPLIAVFNISPICLTECDYHPCKLQWKKLTLGEIQNTYTLLLSSELNKLDQNILENESDVNHFYNTIVNDVCNASYTCIPESSFKPFLKPYWKKGLKKFHKEMLAKRREWILAGKPRGNIHQSYVQYKTTNRAFRLHMRRLEHENEREFFQELDQTSEADQNKFWSLINTRRKKRFVPNCEMNVHGHIYRTTEEKLKVWESYFSYLYSTETDTDKSVHSRLHEEKISVELEGLKITTSFEVDDINGIPFIYCKVRQEINKLKLGKAGGKDSLTNEHLKYGGSVLVACLTQLFNAMYNTESVPSAMKRGLIYTLYKGCKKYEDDRKKLSWYIADACYLQAV